MSDWWNKLKQKSSENQKSEIEEKTQKQYVQCEQWKETAFNRSSLVRFMMRAMSNAGCPIYANQFVTCVACDESKQFKGATNWQENGDIEIIVCQNRIKDQRDFDTVLTHEFIHTYDHCRANLDLKNADHAACTEVRANNLSGDCLFSAEMKRGVFGHTNHHIKCVKRRAALAMKNWYIQQLDMEQDESPSNSDNNDNTNSISNSISNSLAGNAAVSDIKNGTRSNNTDNDTTDNASTGNNSISNFLNSNNDKVKADSEIAKKTGRDPNVLAHDAVARVFERCYKDTEPFGSIPWHTKVN